MSKQLLLTKALKEWAIAITALAAGKTILLLRKGGIKEDSKKFKVVSPKVWLYPTYEHQQSHLLKSPYRSQVREVPGDRHPKTITIQSYAEISNAREVRDLETVRKLSPHHIWTQQMLSDRFRWKTQQPLTVLFLKVANLSEPIILPYNQSYSGCRSWIDLQTPIETDNLIPALTEEAYQQEVQKIITLLARE